MKRVYLHIGIGKTGTSSIQTMMFENREVFRRHGLIYPEVGLYGPTHHRLAPLNCQPATLEAIQRLLAGIRSEFESARADKLLISSEQLCYAKQELISLYHQAFSQFDTQIIFYVRRQDHLIASTFLEWVRSGLDYKSGIEEFFHCHKDAFDFKARLIRWREGFPSAKPLVRVYGATLNESVCIDFLKCLECDEFLDELRMPNRVRISLLPAFYPLIRSIDALNPGREGRERIIQHLLELSKTMTDASRFSLIDEKLRKEIAHTYDKPNRDFAHEFLGQRERELLRFCAPEQREDRP